jgi:uncharacterized membrane protein
MKLTFYCLFICLILSNCLNDRPISPSICKAQQDKTISFQSDVMPIIKAQCLECHDSKNHFDGIVFETYQQISTSAANGELYDSVVSINGALPRMPKGGQLSDCEVAIIKKWIDQQMPNN